MPDPPQLGMYCKIQWLEELGSEVEMEKEKKKRLVGSSFSFVRLMFCTWPASLHKKEVNWGQERENGKKM